MKKLEKLTLKELEFEIAEIPQIIQEQLKGGDITVTFDRSENKIYIYGNGTIMGIFDAANNVSSCSNGPWTNGTFSMFDQNGTYQHSYGDTYGGSYGTDGIFRAEPFVDAGGVYRSGMGLHSGRYDNYEYSTMGCIRTTEEAMEEIQCLIGSFGSFTSISVQD